MFQMHPKPETKSKREPGAGRGSRGWHLRGSASEERVPTREPFVDPVHGRHCICDRCVQHRAAA